MASEVLESRATGTPGDRRLHALGAALRGPAGWVVLAVLVSIAMTAWWLSQDTRVPSWDPGAHIFRSLQYADAFRDGDLTEWFTSYQTPGYPPLVYLLGAFVSLVIGEGVTQFVLTENLVFVPLLALGAYQAGRVAYGKRAGAYAVMFILGTPLVIAQSHVFMLDMPQTAMVAVAIWLLLATRRFERGGFAFAAGVACGLGMLSKNIFPLMVGGVIAVMLLRGGWRRPKGIGLFVLGGLITGVPWYIAHFDGLLAYASGGSVSGGSSIYGTDPARWSPDDWLYYLWEALNAQLYLPLWLFGAAGVAWAVARLVRRRPWAPDDATPELLGGLLGGIVLSVALTHNDVRYTMPLLVYVAILGTAWFAVSARRTLRIAAGAALVAICALNLFTVSTGDGPDVTIDLPGDWHQISANAGNATLLSTRGWLVAGPENGGDVSAKLRAAREQGARHIVVDRVGAGTSDLNPTGIYVLARFAGLEVQPQNDYAGLAPRDLYITGGSAQAEPCGRTETGIGIYYERGSDVQPVSSADNLVCPTRSDATYAAPSPSRPDPAAQAILLRELRAAHRQGVRTAYFQEMVPGTGLFGGAHDLRALAQRAGLQPPPGGLGANVGPTGLTAVVLPHYDAIEPLACRRLPDDSGLILLKGPVKTLTLLYADNLYCPTRSAELFSGPGGG